MLDLFILVIVLMSLVMWTSIRTSISKWIPAPWVLEGYFCNEIIQMDWPDQKINFLIITHTYEALVSLFSFFNDFFSLEYRLVGGLKNIRGLHLQHFEELVMQFPVSNQATHLHSSPPFSLENHHLLPNKHIGSSLWSHIWRFCSYLVIANWLSCQNAT